MDKPTCIDCGQVHGDAKAGAEAARAAWVEGRAKAAHRRARVLAHPDIAKALTEPPLRYSSPEMWEGHVPPAWIPTKSGWKPNRTATRSALISICERVVARESETAADTNGDAA